MSANLFPTSQAESPSSLYPKKADGGWSSSVAASLAQTREQLIADSVWTCRANLERRKDASVGQTREECRAKE